MWTKWTKNLKSSNMGIKHIIHHLQSESLILYITGFTG